MIFETIGVLSPIIGYAFKRKVISNIKHLGPGVVKHIHHKDESFQSTVVFTPRGVLPVIYMTPAEDIYTLEVKDGLHQVTSYYGKTGERDNLYYSNTESSASDNHDVLKNRLSENIMIPTILLSVSCFIVAYIFRR